MKQGSAQGFMDWRRKNMSQKTEPSAGVGHNSNAKGDLASYVDRLENLEQEKQSYVDDIRDVCKEAKEKGFDAKALKYAVKMRRMSAEQRDKARKQEELNDSYLDALGMLA